MSKSYPELYAEFITKLGIELPPKSIHLALDRVVDIANERTRELQEARDTAFKAYLKVDREFNKQWLEVWTVNRDLTLAEEGIE